VTGVRSFEISVPDAVLDDLRVRLARTRPARGALAGWSAGTDPGYLASFVTSWAGAYQWRDTESLLNGLPQLLVSVAGADIHVFHVRARTPAAGAEPMPLVLTHGWPSSFFEFLPLIGPLTDPVAHGADPADAFDVVIPSLPGFGFSGPLPAGQNQPARVADAWVELMDQLGYRRFGAYGGDIGSHVTNFLGARHADRLIGIFTHHPELHPHLDGGRPLSAAEQRYLDQRARTDHDDSYAATQSARPNSLAPGLADSPAGLAAWILDKYRDWSDCRGDIESAIDRTTLLNIITLYWVTNSIGTSFLHYADDAETPPLPPVTVPAGLILTPEDGGYPLEFAERAYADIRLWRGPEPGGHFLALERPARLIRDLRDFYRPLRASTARSRR
jgi:epoxide hydrolase